MRIANTIRNVKNWRSYYVHKFLGLNEGFVFDIGMGKIYVPPRLIHTFKEIFFDGAYFRYIPRSVLKKPNPVVVDIGANVGYFSLLSLERLNGARVYSYEPMPVNFSQMSKYLGELGKEGWHIENKAVAGTPGLLNLHYDASDSFTTAATLFGQAGSDVLQVQCITLEAILSDADLSQIDILKLDCEGAEYDILYSAPDAVLDRIRSIAMETHPGPAKDENRASLQRYLSGKGFRTRTDSGALLWAWK